jgi:DNA-binding MarR family transcriptional regulator
MSSVQDSITPPEPDIEERPLDQGQLLGLVGYNCTLAYLHVMSYFRKRMAQYDLRPVDYTILTLVNANPDLNQTRLARAINVSPPNLPAQLARLEKRGLLMRKRNPADRRSHVLALTPEGRGMCIHADKTVAELEDEATSVLTAEERAALLGLLQKIFLRG